MIGLAVQTFNRFLGRDAAERRSEFDRVRKTTNPRSNDIRCRARAVN